VNTRGSSQIGRGQPLDELADLGIDARTPTLGPATPRPEPAESCSVPLDDSGRLDDDQRVSLAAPPAREHHPEAPVYVRQPGAFDRAFEDAKLVTQGEDLHGQLAARSDAGKCGEEHGPDEVEHGCGAWPGPGRISTISQQTTFLGGTPTHCGSQLSTPQPVRSSSSEQSLESAEHCQL
jgi:hypothetical protein